MIDALARLPFWQAFIALWCIVMLRSNATYWVGRGAIAGWQRLRDRPSRASRVRAERLIRRLGPVAVALSYLTIGIQTTIHLTAGALRMPMRLYLPAAVIGSAAWAAIYATIGIAIVQAWLAAMAGSWYALAALVALLVVGVATWLIGRRHSESRAAATTAQAPGSDHT